ncbi:HNH endonuclease [Rhizobium giardinii]|uniref:HNH endonuclease n=1 Tax=Rhizobium giardinii TaxID=56731 RepID=UPI0039E1F3D0
MRISKRERFIADALQSSVKECVEWPFAVRKSSGYGAHTYRVARKQKNVDVHRYVCELAHGSPDPGKQAAHDCGNKICVNPDHLYWASNIENMEDAKRHGTLKGGGRFRQRLFDDDVEHICTSGESLIALGARYGMDPSYIGRVRRKHASVG